jgi:hypothetical protein
LLGCVDLLLLPKVRLFAFIPLLADPGCLVVLALLVSILRNDPRVSR